MTEKRELELGGETVPSLRGHGLLERFLGLLEFALGEQSGTEVGPDFGRARIVRQERLGLVGGLVIAAVLEVCLKPVAQLRNLGVLRAGVGAEQHPKQRREQPRQPVSSAPHCPASVA